MWRYVRTWGSVNQCFNGLLEAFNAL